MCIKDALCERRFESLYGYRKSLNPEGEWDCEANPQGSELCASKMHLASGGSSPFSGYSMACRNMNPDGEWVSEGNAQVFSVSPSGLHLSSPFRF